MNWNTPLRLELLFCNIPPELFVFEPDELKHTTRTRGVVLYHSSRTICFGTWWIASRATLRLFIFPSFFIVFSSIFHPPWYNRTGWLGVKHQATYLLHSTTHTYVSRLSRWLFHADTIQRRLELTRPIIRDLNQADTLRLTDWWRYRECKTVQTASRQQPCQMT